MSNRKISILKPAHANFLRALLVSIFAAAIFATTASALSMRRSLNAPSPTHRARILNPPPERDIDAYLGKIVRKDGDIVIVNITTNFRSPDRKAVFFGCDANLTPTSILQPLGITHKNCAAFRVVEGTAIVGDGAMVKYFAPEKANKATEN